VISVWKKCPYFHFSAYDKILATIRNEETQSSKFDAVSMDMILSTKGSSWNFVVETTKLNKKVTCEAVK